MIGMESECGHQWFFLSPNELVTELSGANLDVMECRHAAFYVKM